MRTRAKFEVTRVSESGYGGKRNEINRVKQHTPANVQDSEGVSTRYDRTEYESTGIPVREITMSAVYGGSKENESFAQATPSGTITFQLDNPALADEFKPGKAYYVDFTPVE
jgi:hypothetical protein